MQFDFDVIVIGAGIIGASIGDELAKKKLKVAILERNLRVGQETTTGNSGIIHGGFDPTPGKLNAQLNVEGRKLYENYWFKELDFPWKKTDSLVLAFSDIEQSELQKLYERGLKNNLNSKEIALLTKEEVLTCEPNINKNVKGALLCTVSYIVDPLLLTNSLIKRMTTNKGQLFLNHKVVKIVPTTSGFQLTCLTNEQEVTFTCQFIVNAAGHYADEIANLINCHDFRLTTRRGQYCILEKTESHVLNNHILFMVPTIHGKGIIVAPMTDGHLLVGPTAIDNVPKSETRLVTIAEVKKIANIGTKIIPNLKMNKTCQIISGSRSICVETDDFIIKSASNNPHFINVAGIKSPGLSSAPAIAQLVTKLITNNFD